MKPLFAMRRVRTGIGSLIILVVLLAAWEAAVRQFGWSPLVLPAPSRVWHSLWSGLVAGYFWPHIVQTTREVLLGLLLGGAIGFGMGLLLAQSRFVQAVLMPYILASQVVPKLALAPLLTLWLGFGTLPMVVITALVCFFPLLENTLTGLGQTDQARLELFRMLGASRWQTLWRLRLPMAMPGVMAGVRIAAVLALVGAVVGEFIGASQGLGALIIAAQGSMDTALMFAVLLLITILGLLLYQLSLLLQHIMLRHYSSTRESSAHEY
ncbi:ABC transporter permease [Paracandidimonas lactea]|uniref:ABC transporter permease n=1 Tax=Paracandidimonas lactea TaxID=2895524 RepID=UPI001F310F46|nr:ABC transporter permease [Paracandidimonas lactea]